MAGVGDKLMTASEIKAVTDTKLANDFSSLPVIGHSLENDYLFAVQSSNKNQASKITYSAFGTDILNKIGSNGIVSVNHGGTGASDASGARTNLDVYSKSEMNSAIAKGAAPVGIGDLFTNRSTYFDYHYARKSGKLVIIGFIVKAGATNGTVLCTIDDSIKPETNDYIAPLVYRIGKVNTKGTVWIEASNTSQIKYYGDTIPNGEGSYATMVYMVR